MSRLLRCCAYYFAFVFVLILGSNAFAAGYTCPSYKKYTSCNAGFYISNCGSSSNWTGQTLTSSALTTGNSCIACPDGYTCQSTAGLVCPKVSTVTCSPGTYLAANATSCSNCGGNAYYCPGGTFTPSSSAQGRSSVSSGYYSTGGTSTTRTDQAKCEAGNKCASGVKTECSGSLEYQDATGQTVCKGVSTGYYKSSNSAQAQCDDGYRNIAATSRNECVGTFSKSGSQVDPAMQTGCEARSLTACTPGTCNYTKKYSGTVVSDCTPTNCTKTQTCTSASTNYYLDSGAAKSCSSFSSTYTKSDGGSITSAYCYISRTNTGSQVNGSIPTNCHSVTEWNACTPGTCTYKDYYSATDTTCTPTNCTKTPKTVTAKAGSYVNGQTCSQCSAGYYQGTNGSTATSCTAASKGYNVPSAGSSSQTACAAGKYQDATGQSSCKSCPTLTSGYAYTSTTGLDAVTKCTETKAASSVSSYCYSGQLTKTATSTTAWGTATSTLTAKAGSHLSGSGDSATCSQCSGATYQTSNGSTATSCSSCPAQTSGWTRNGGTGWTAVTSCNQTKTGTAISSYCSAGVLKQNATSAGAWGTTTIVTALQAAAGSYVNGQTCSQCTGRTYSAGGTVTSCSACLTAESGWTAAGGGNGQTSYTTCKETKTGSAISSYCSAGVLTKTQSSASAWGSASITTPLQAKAGSYVNGQTCSQCTGATYSAGGTVTSCATCPSIYTSNTTAGKSLATQCQVKTTGGYYIANAQDSTQTQCGQKFYCPSETVNYGSTNSPTACPDAATHKRTTFPSNYYSPTITSVVNQSWGAPTAASAEGCLVTYAYSNARGTFTTESIKYNATSGKYDGSDGRPYYNTVKAGYYLKTQYTSTYCNTSSNRMLYTDAQPCLENHYCPGLSSMPLCSSGTYGEILGASLIACSTLAGGAYPNSTGTATATTAAACYLTTSQGKFVAAENAAETTCAAGGYCPGGTKVNYGSTGGRTACSGGKYNASTGSSAASACVACVTGSYSASGATACIACQSGKTTSTTGQTSCNANCSNAANVGAWKTATWNTNNTMTNLCTIDSASSSACSAAVKGTGAASASWTVSSNKCVYSGTCSSKYYKPTASGTTVSCTGCPTAYPNSANGNAYSSDAYCYLTLKAGQQVASAGAGASNCSTGRYCTSTSNIFKGTAGGTATYTGTACQTGSYQDATGQTVCKPCAAGKTNSGTGNTAACTTSCTAISNLSTWATTTWSNGTVGNLCTVDKCAANSYKSGNTCPTCSSGTDSKYTKSAVGTTSVNSCYLTTTAGKYVATAKAGEVGCPAGSYCGGGTTIYYGTGTQTGGSASCSTATSSKYPSSAAGASKVGQCYLTLTAKKQVASAGAGASACSAGRYCTSTAKIYYNTDGGTATYTGTQCVAGSYSEAGASSCVACGAGKTSTAGATSLSACTSCSAITNLSTWASSTWNTNNTMSNLCTVGNCAANSYKSGNTCPTCSSGTDSKYTKSAAGTTSVNSCYLTTEAGKYVATAKAGQVACPADSYCVGGTTIYYGTGTTTGGSASCSALSGVSVAGGTYSSVSPRSASSNCRYTAPAPTVPTYCATKTSNTVSYTGNAWPTSTYAVTAKAGSVISGNNTKDATCSQCGAGKFSAGGTETSCGSCPAAETGWTMSTAAGLSAVTQCTEITTPTTSGSPIATICTAGTLTKKATSTSAWGNATASGLTAKAGRYVNGTTCSACAAGTYTSAASTATSCTAASKGYYVSGTEQTAQSACAAGTYTSATGQSKCTDAAAGTYTTGCQITNNNTACTGTAVCANNTWSGAKASSCTSCTTAKGYGNSGTTAAAHNGIASCKVTCGGGKYVATAGAGCVDVGIGYWGAGGTVAENATLARNQCAAGLTTIGSGRGADEAADCGRVLNFNGQKIYLRSEKRTTPSLNISINGTTFYGNMTEGTSKGSLRINSGGTVYSVHDDSM